MTADLSDRPSRGLPRNRALNCWTDRYSARREDRNEPRVPRDGFPLREACACSLSVGPCSGSQSQALQLSVGMDRALASKDRETAGAQQTEVNAWQGWRHLKLWALHFTYRKSCQLLHQPCSQHFSRPWAPRKPCIIYICAWKDPERL